MNKLWLSLLLSLKKSLYWVAVITVGTIVVAIILSCINCELILVIRSYVCASLLFSC